MYSYYKLIYGAENGCIVRAENGAAEIYEPFTGWKPFYALQRYFLPYDDNEYYDKYEGITEKEANDAIRKAENN